MAVRYRDGIEIELSDGTRVCCDAETPDGDITVVSHAHGDHLPDGETTAVCSELTAALGSVRREAPLHRETDERVELRPAGHVAGSRAAIITDPDGTTYCYTGDVCTRSRFYLDGFEPPDVDVLVTEATYGEPEFVFPPHETVAGEITTWLDETTQPALLFGYALGRAQKLQLLAGQTEKTVYTTDAVLRVNDPIEAHLDVAFPATRYDEDVELGEDTDAVTAGFSGWAVDSAYRFRGDFDTAFPLSDHCDFAELCALVAAVDPKEVYTQHGSGDALTEQLTSEGYTATTIKQNQRSLNDF